MASKTPSNKTTSRVVALLLTLLSTICAKKSHCIISKSKQMLCGADLTEAYVPYLKRKNIAVVVNQTSQIGNRHLVDSLISLGIRINKVFAPEHGFRGDHQAGADIRDTIDAKTGVKIVSLYGRRSKPNASDLKDVDLVVFDIQDVGCRFYTYINTLRDVMEACAENSKELLLLDRPNPNAYLVDGPVLDMTLRSGIGQFPIPISYGMTIGEFAQMINGEGWLKNKIKCSLRVIGLKNYNHDMPYALPIPPSPNLNTQLSILLYPTTCLLEGTYLNHGRGTLHPFVWIGAPAYRGKYTFSFTPHSINGMCNEPIYKDEECFGLDLTNISEAQIRRTKKIDVQLLIDLYNNYPAKDSFFSIHQGSVVGNIDALIGDSNFKFQVRNGMTESEIRASWHPQLMLFKQKREKYLLYE